MYSWLNANGWFSFKSEIKYIKNKIHLTFSVFRLLAFCTCPKMAIQFLG
jgi:hypothetical protein